VPDVPRVKQDHVSAHRPALPRRTVAGSASLRSAAPLPGTTTPVPAYDTRDPSLGLLIENIADILNSEVALYLHLDGPGQPPEVVCSWGLGDLNGELARPRGGGLIGRALGAQRAILEPLNPDDHAALIGAGGDPTLQYAVSAPVRPAAGAAAALVAVFSVRPPDEALTLWTSEACGAMLALGAQRPEMLDTLLPTRLDALTGCLNYAGIRRALEKEINRSTRGDLSLSLCFIDLDGFKRVNDQHGHLRGNEVLREVSQILRQSVRSCDTVGRFGGDEFVVILPDTDEPDAMRFTARVQSRLAAATVSAAGGPLTASVGMARWSPGATVNELLARADEALLSAKRATHRFGGPRSIRQGQRSVSRVPLTHADRGT
jgi:diguanylate cyclase (GGDEF)-like protein